MKASSDHISPESRSTRQCGTAQRCKKTGWHLLMGIALFTFFTGYGAGLKAQQSITYKQELDGAAGQLAKDSSRTVMDSVFLNPGSFPAIDSLEPYKVSNIIVFHINETSPRMLPDSFKAELTLRVYFTNGNEVSDSVTEKKLNIDYYKSKPYNNKAVYYFSDARLVTVKVIDITSAYPALSTILPLLKLENRMVISRVFAMDCQNDAIKSVSHSTATVSTKGELKVSWASLNAAQQYDLEWTFIDQSALDAGWYNTGGSLDAEKIFRNNATRVTIHANNYNIPLLYEGNGKLFYRVRAAQTMVDKERKVTLWSSDFVSQGGLGEYVYSGHELSLNWQAATSFAEEGKRKSVVQYFDGTLRNRQTVTKDNTTDTTVVAETFYDKQGRAVIQVLPAPTLSSLISYNPLFNQARVDGAPVENTPGVYDTLKAATDYCAAGAPPLDSVSGASQYYSYNNPNKLNPIHKFIPQAKGYPFTEVKYSQDNTGRIVSQGGVGPQFQLNSGHETKYYYGTPLQTELDALFGTEAGYASHYQKNMVRDANGQYSVSYVDMHGRTVATALAGAVPDSMQALASFRDSIQTDNLLTPVNNVIKGNTIESTSALLVTKAGVNSFHYSLNAESLQLDDKDAVEICYDCLYDLTITISDDCNNQNLPGDSLFVFHKSNMRVQSPVYDTTCTIVADTFDVVLGVALQEGSYLVTKKLTLRQDAMAYYRDSLYTPHNTVRTKEDIIAEQLSRIREQRGNDCVQEGQPWYSYQQYHEQMLLDMTPPFGQYARYPNDPNDPRNKGEDYLNLFSIFDKEGNPGVYVYKNIAYTGSYPRSPNEMSPEDFISNFQPQWAEDLVREKHPEGCLLSEYESYKASHHWDADFEATDTYQQALAKGYLNPTNSTNPPASGFGNGNDSLFFTHPGAKSWFNTALLNYKTNDDQILSLWAAASIIAHCDTEDATCVNSFQDTPSNVFNSSFMGCEGELDMAWRFFRNEYLRLKRGWIDDQIRSVCGSPVLQDKASPVFLNESAAIGLAGNLLSTDRATAQQAAADSLSSIANSTCLAYAQSWWRQLAGCNYNTTDSAIIIPRLIEVCKQGSDTTHPFGASSVRPASTYTYSSFDEVISQYNTSIGKPNNAACNAYLIDAPGPYNRPVLAVEQPLYTKPDDCTCEKIGALKAQYETASGYSSFSDYIQKTLHTTISQNALDSLLNLCNGNIACRYIAKPITLPPALQCATGYDVCVDCNAVNNVYTSFKASFPDIIPTYEEMTEQQQGNNRLFASYMNNKLGFSKPAQEYLVFMDSCGVTIPGECDSMQTLISNFNKDVNPYRVNAYCHWESTNEIRDLDSIISDGKLHYPTIIQDTTPGGWWRYFQHRRASGNYCTSSGYSIEFRFKFKKNVLNANSDFFYLNHNNGAFILFKLDSQHPTLSRGLYLTSIQGIDSATSAPVTVSSGYSLIGNDPNLIFTQWNVVKYTVTPTHFKVYFNSVLIRETPRTTAPLKNFSSFALCFMSPQAELDWTKIYDANDRLTFFDDYNSTKTRQLIDPSFACPQPATSCQTTFTNYFNQQKGTSYTFDQVDSVYFNTCGRHLDVCGSNYKFISDTLKQIVDSFYVQAKPGRVTHHMKPQEEATITDLTKIVQNGIVMLPDSIRNLPGAWYNDYQMNFNRFCTDTGYTIEMKFKFLENDLYGDVFYLGFRSIQATFYRSTVPFNGNPPGLYYHTIQLYGYGGGTVETINGYVLVDSNYNSLLDWMVFKAVVKPDKYELYYNGRKIFDYNRNPTIAIGNQQNFGLGLKGRYGAVDWVRVGDVNDNIKYFEDFNDITRMATVDESFICTPFTPCQQSFTTYFNQVRGTSYTFGQIDSVYTAHDLVLDACRLDTATIRCDQLENYVDEYKDQLGQPASGYMDLDMRTFAGNKTPDEGPKGVFDVKGKLLGNTVDSTPTAVKQSYVQIWNSSADNREVGTLSLLETGKFRLTLNPGKQAPKEGIIGQRYYQLDSYDQIAPSLMTAPGSFIDYGEGKIIKIDTTNNSDSTSIEFIKGVEGAYFGMNQHYLPDFKPYSYFIVSHFYPDANHRTISIYHTDYKGAVYFTNGSLHPKNLRGFMPQETLYLVLNDLKDSAYFNMSNIRNFSQITSIENLSIVTDSFSNSKHNLSPITQNKNLKVIHFLDGSNNNADETPLSKITPALNENFKMLRWVQISGATTANFDSINFTLPRLRYLALSYLPLTSDQLDRVLNQIASVNSERDGLILTWDISATRTSASDSAVNKLLSQDWQLILTNNWSNFVRITTPEIIDNEILPVSTPFTDFINSKFSTSLTAAQVDSLYLARCGHKPDWYTQPDTSFPAGLLLCGKNEPVSPTLSYEEVYDPPCSDSSTLAFNSGTEIYTMYKDSLNNIFDSLYTAKCLGAAALEQFTVKRNVSEYHYTLYYYDQAGNLVKTIPPEGVNISRHPDTLALVAQKRLLGESYPRKHTMPTVYRYNSLNQVVSQKTPDAGKSSNWYDRLGRLAISQNAQQKLDGKYSYTRYDVLGRITEVGQKPQSAAMTNIISRDTTALANWLFYNNNGANGAEMVTQTVYDVPGIDATACIAELRFTQKPYTLRNQVSYTRYYEKPAYYNGGDGRYYISGQSYATGIDYSYDIHGNVDTMRNLYGALQYGPMANHGYNACKTIAYTYDLISGKVNEVHYNPGQNDEFYHRYEYDAENRLTDVYTADNKIFLHQQELEEHEAFYAYYRHGPLARMVLGQQQVQGVDYAYTLQGWLKGINSSNASITYDMGGDATGLNPGVALDAYSFTLHYFYGDYDPINTARLPFAEPSLHANLAYRPLYNGNISSMGHSIPLRYVNQLYNYKYDQLNRLVEMDMYRGLDGTNKWATLAISNLYQERYKYDGNGNIKTALRNGHLTANPLMDSLTYFYTGGTNRLDHIRDRNVGSTTHSNNYAPAVDIKDQAAGNYSYDAIGNLKSSEWMGDDNISWNVYGKVVEVEKRALAGVTSRLLHYYYDPSGNKTGETVRHGSGGSAYYNHRWYVRDAQGNVLATYEVNNAASASAGTLKLKEQHLYGSSRLGIINRDQDVDANKLTAVDETNLGDTYLLNFTRGNKLFELTNHLGNVLTVLSDKKMGRKASDPSMISIYDFDMVTASDYTPFGMVMQGRNFSFLSRYRYGFNGKEYDNEFKGAGNLLDYGNRLYDPLVGSFMSVDPLTGEYPELTPYQFASNTPIQGIDLDGKEIFYHDPLAGLRLLKGMFLGWASDFSNGALKTREGVAQLGLAKHQQASYNNPNVPQYVQNRLNQNDKLAGANKVVEGTRGMVQASADAVGTVVPLGEGVSAGKNSAKALGRVVEKKALSGAEKAASSMANNAVKMSENALVKSGNEAVQILEREVVVREIISSNGFLSSAIKPWGNQGLTNVGRALQKHIGREGSVFQKIKFSHRTANEEGLKILNQIINSKSQIMQDAENGGRLIFDKNSRMGFGISREGLFNGFRELPKK